jgi:DNA polymerase-3 subunit epsilon
MLERVLIIDTETTGLEPETSQIIEIGAILYSVCHQMALQQTSVLFPAETNPAENINRIKPAALANLPTSVTVQGLATIREMAQMADVIAAHNADFDRQWFSSTSPSQGLLPELTDAQGHLLPWVCTCQDFEWPKQIRPGQSLVELALAHDIGVVSNHRALTDCQLLAALFDRMPDLSDMFERALRPKARFAAVVSYQKRELAKQAGFKWYPDRKTWERVMAVEDIKMLPFPVRSLEPIAS